MKMNKPTIVYAEYGLWWDGPQRLLRFIMKPIPWQQENVNQKLIIQLSMIDIGLRNTFRFIGYIL